MVLDADPGHSGISPILCIGTRQTTAFAGILEPIQNPIGYLSELSHLIDQQREKDQTIIVLLPVPLRGFGYTSLIQAAIRSQSRCKVAVMQMETECERILSAFTGLEFPQIHRLDFPVGIETVPKYIQKQISESAIVLAFSGATEHTYNLDQVVMRGTWLLSGNPLPPHVQKFMSRSLGVPIYYGEMDHGVLSLVTGNAEIQTNGASIIQETYPYRELVLTPVKSLQGLLVGLYDTKEIFVGLGRIHSINFKDLSITLSARLRVTSAVKRVHFGLIRTNKNYGVSGINRLGDT